MNTCIGCVYAKWERRADGKAHPSGNGRCEYKWEMPPLPASMYWIGKKRPVPLGGRIYRKQEFTDKCPYYTVET